MKKIMLLLSLLFSLSMADATLLVKKGWQLIGSSTPLDDMSKFQTDNVEQVWHFDAKTQTWLGYSPDSDIQAKIAAQKINTLTKLKNWHGFWVKSTQDWAMTFETTTLSSEPSQANSSDNIELKKGWNLISLPIDMVVSADIFEGMVTWKYNETQWELANDTETNPDIPTLGHIKNSDGIWVKSNEDKNISISQEASKLHNFSNNEEMTSYIKEMATLYQRPYCGIEPFPISVNDAVISPTTSDDLLDTTGTTEDMLAENRSSTNLQEEEVDEADILKHNETNIFYLGTSSNGLRNRINISSFEKLTNKETDALQTISFSEEHRIDSFYLVQNKLVVLSKFNPKDVNPINKEISYGANQTIVDMFDVSNIENIEKVSTFKLHGYLDNSRVIGDNLYLISAFHPEYKITYPKEYIDVVSAECQNYVVGSSSRGSASEVTTSLDMATSSNETPQSNKVNSYAACYGIHYEEENRYFRYNYDKPIVEVINALPQIEGTDLAKQTLVKHDRLYASAKKKQTTTIMSISNFSIDNGKYLKSTSYIGDSSVEYASSNALYLVSNDYPFFYDFNNYKSRSQIYKFAFDNALSYKAIGSVYGTALNQFSLSEHENILRIATTEGFSWGSNGTNNRLYTLKEKNQRLTIEGSLSGLGKEGETIQAVRFMGNKAYVVTFRTTDPLYTIDLSDPQAPKKMGELEVNGYSAYLHPIGEDKLLGIGQDADEEGRRKGVKIELFDISDFENPSSLDSITLAKGTYAEVEFNHKALAYRSRDHLFAFPFSNYGTELNNYQHSNHLGIYQVTNNSLKSYETLNDNSQNWGEHRGLIFDLNATSYVSFFSDDTVITKTLTNKEN